MTEQQNQSQGNQNSREDNRGFIRRNASRLFWTALGGAVTFAYFFPGRIPAVDDIWSVLGAPKTVYDGKIGDWDVLYREGKNSSNLRVRKNDLVVHYWDTDSPPKLDFLVENQKPFAYKVEALRYQDKKGDLELNRADIKPSQYDSKVKNDIFDASDRNYNAFLTGVAILKARKNLDRLEEVLNNIKIPELQK